MLIAQKEEQLKQANQQLENKNKELNALYEQNEGKCGNSADFGGEGKETHNEEKENL